MQELLIKMLKERTEVYIRYYMRTGTKVMSYIRFI